MKTVKVGFGVFALFAWLLPAGWAQEVFPVTYQQERLMLVDEKGDAILVQLFWDTCQTGLKKCQTGENVPPQESQLRAPRFAQENPILARSAKPVTDNTRVVPLFDTQKTLENLEQIMREFAKKGLPVVAGEKHVWSSKYPYLPSKIIVALGTAVSARFMYVGQEKALIGWIKTRPDNSIRIEDLFRQSYQLNNGNVYLTVLTIENVLSDATFEADRENTLVNRKLTELYAHSPNKFGDWYHFFGTMLAGYVEEPARVIAEMYGVYRKISRGDAAEKSTMDADKQGAVIGTGLRNFVDRETQGIIRYLLKRVRVSVARQTTTH